MNKCSFYQLILRLVPVMALKDLIIRHHVEACPRCSSELANPSEVSSILLFPEKADTAGLLWSKIKENLVQEKTAFKTPQVKLRPIHLARTKLVVGSAAIVIILIAIVSSFLFIMPARHKQSLGPILSRSGLVIINFRVKEKPAAPIIYQPYGSNLIFIWAEVPHDNFNP